MFSESPLQHQQQQQQQQEQRRTLNLFLGEPPANVENDKCDDDDVIYFEGVIESLTDDERDKHSCFSEIKKEEALLMKKAYFDLMYHSAGNYYKYHTLLDALLMYKTCVELIDDSAWSANVIESCETFVTFMFRLFGLFNRIVVVVPANVNWEEDNLSALLKQLSQLSIITIEQLDTR
ncbi:hypothetical protein SlsnVgp079 [Spodoptera littoralis nucleopolyhedrovirus]|uniref:P18 n=1 Tax=Spodoptera littoralis nuclear polyhedrosis virus TaxID=10456 RepID=M1J4B2_NPVSL|nr:hypothetical protein SlsnVgp079 [Spodoptera littoralis nucleopolyhedrovirus]AGE89934.1 hypothetical protein SlsnVgp079 [Spodoptera littoralis nucleopolyhedrovirus]